MLILVCIF
uniref:Uncharacterized protein n=1 Tax=Arundo donax TaxID=35708 RepID=A0A0A8Z523_ARUDO